MATVFTDAGKRWVADKIRATGGAATGVVEASPNDVQNKIAWGTGAGTAAVGDTTLFTEASEARVTGVMSSFTTDVTGDTYQVVGTITANGTKTITNAGLFDATTVGDMLIKGDFSGIPVLLGDSIEFTFRLDMDDCP